MKQCATCQVVHPLFKFHSSGKGFRADCKDCRAKKDRRDKLRRHYNITPEQYDAMLESQHGVCRICKQSEILVDKNGVVMSLAVDHDHSCCPGPTTCGECIRGLLCYRCNIALGMLEDDVTLLLRSIMYLRGSLDGN